MNLHRWFWINDQRPCCPTLLKTGHSGLLGVIKQWATTAPRSGRRASSPCSMASSRPSSHGRTPWSNCYRPATASELIWLRRNVTGGRFSNLYQRVYFAYTNLANHRRCTKLLPRWQGRGRSRCGLGLLQNTQEFLLPVGTHASVSRLLTAYSF